MGIIIRKAGNGKLRSTWYGVFEIDGKRRTVNLGVTIKGTVPASLKDRGDTAFENSRTKAQAAFDSFLAEARERGNAEHLTRRLVEIKTGEKPEDIPLADLFGLERARLVAIWKDGDELTRNHAVYLDQRKTIFDRFAKWGSAQGIRHVHEITTALVGRYFDDLEGAYSRESVGKHLHILSSAWKKYAPSGLRSPFGDIPDRLRVLSKKNPGIPRKPLTAAELLRLFETARRHDLASGTALKLYPLTVTAACTGLRIGDVCNLRWTSVDLLAKPNPLLSLTTSKTGSSVCLPIFEELRPVLEAALAERADGEEYVFPAAHIRYQTDSAGIPNYGKRLFAKALFGCEPQVEELPDRVKPPQDIIDEIKAAKWTAQKRERAEAVYTRYAVKDETYSTISKALGITGGQVSGYLTNIEALVGQKVRKQTTTYAAGRAPIEATRQERKGAGNAASVYGWHSLRASFVCLALARGIPKELVRKIVGHATITMTERYFNPTEKHSADLFASYTGGRLLPTASKQAAIGAAGTRHALTATTTPATATDAPQADFEALREALARLTPEERDQLLNTTK